MATPIAMVPMGTLPEIHFGRIDSGHRCFHTHREYLKRTVDEPFALFFSV